MIRVHVSARHLMRAFATALACVFMTLAVAAAENRIMPFVGSYSGVATLVSADGTTRDRDLSVSIAAEDDGFVVAWSTTTFAASGEATEKSYEIRFVPRNKQGLYAAAMRKDLFGHDVQLDPMKGEPYVWGQIVGDTLKVYALFVDPEGGYEMQQYDRTLVDGGLKLDFVSVRDGARQRSLSSFLERQ